MRIYQAITVFAVAASAFPTQLLAVREGPSGDTNSPAAPHVAQPEQLPLQDRPPTQDRLTDSDRPPIVVENGSPVQDYPPAGFNEHRDGSQHHPTDSSSSGQNPGRPATQDHPAEGDRRPVVIEDRPPVQNQQPAAFDEHTAPQGRPAESNSARPVSDHPPVVVNEHHDTPQDHPAAEPPRSSGHQSSRPPARQHFEKIEHPGGNPNSIEKTSQDIINDDQHGVHSNIIHHVVTSNSIVNGKPTNVNIHGTTGVANNGKNNVVLPNGFWNQFNPGQPGAGLPGTNFIPAGLGVNSRPPSDH
ncbi:hypothetical protein DL89DRAFT_134340 [Linderina pennispora]|uniref:Uncharacterized protein n=1 Tax=Linderina pennispora TaxID=61395 RepID=A0A1Y1WBA8_9FUNG|nr:uncharacterized protein DL89DRAFT_134340 [Linderina pennispora]ORX70444.1 hypothetical protein DL89DRAFT_134340 [Linderina pennispora]